MQIIVNNEISAHFLHLYYYHTDKMGRVKGI